MLLQRVRFEIATSSLLKVVAVALLLWFLYAVREVLAILFVAIIVASAVDPLVEWFVKRKIPRIFGVLIIYISLLSLVSLVVAALLPPALNQIHQLATNFPQYWQRFSYEVANFQQGLLSTNIPPAVTEALDSFRSGLALSGENIIGTVTGIFGGIASFVLIMVMTFYLLMEEQAIKRLLRLVAPAHYQPYLSQLLFRMRDKVGLWLRGQLVLSFIIGLVVFIGLQIFGLFYPLFREYALALALLAFLLEFIPYLGPLLAAIPSVFIGLVHSLPLAIAVGCFYIIMQWFENNIIVPQIMRRAVGLNPILVIVALLVGARVGGIIGIVLAIPVATVLLVLVEDIFQALDEREVIEDKNNI